MNTTLRASEWLPSFLTPFVSLSYPVERPPNPDSFPNSSYYDIGILDFCFIITCIAVMAIARDFMRLGVCEPFAKWYLTRRLYWQKSKITTPPNEKVNGAPLTRTKSNTAANGNGNPEGYAAQANSVITKQEAKRMRHSVIRFAEQGWPAIYYTAQFAYGVVSTQIAIFALIMP